MYRWVWRIVSPRRAGEAKPLENVDSITMYGSGNETALAGDAARTISQRLPRRSATPWASTSRSS